MANPVEMAHTLDGVVKRLQADAKYPELFKTAWGTDQITIDMVAKSIASFERTVIAGDSPFDRFYYGHDFKAMPASAQAGLRIFMSRQERELRGLSHHRQRAIRSSPTISFTISASAPTRAAN